MKIAVFNQIRLTNAHTFRYATRHRRAVNKGTFKPPPMVAHTGGKIECEIEPIRDVEVVRLLWLELQKSAQCSFYLSWGWIGTWLQQLPHDIQPLLLIARVEKHVVGLAVIVSRTLFRHGFVRSRAAFINKTGGHELDEITIEYNGFLASPGNRERVTHAALDFLIASGWDEIFIDAIERNSDLPLIGTGWTTQPRKVWLARGVDLDKLRPTRTNYLQSLVSNTRYQIRHALRAYGKLGEMRIEVAQNVQEANLYFGELRRLHQAYWVSKGLPGAFANPVLNQFHEALIAERFERGEIQLIRVGFGGKWIGYLYGFYWHNAVLNYQSGLVYDLLPRNDRPGLVTHFAAIEFNSSKGGKYYDFLGGDSQHKRVLSNASVSLLFLVARRTCAMFKIEDSLRMLKNALRNIPSLLVRGPKVEK